MNHMANAEVAVGLLVQHKQCHYYAFKYITCFKLFLFQGIDLGVLAEPSLPFLLLQ